MAADYSFELNSIETNAIQFFGLNNLFLGSESEFAVHIGSSIFILDYEVLAQISILTEMWKFTAIFSDYAGGSAAGASVVLGFLIQKAAGCAGIVMKTRSSNRGLEFEPGLHT